MNIAKTTPLIFSLLLISITDMSLAETAAPLRPAAPCQGNVGYMPFAIGPKEDIGTVSAVEKATSGLFGGAVGGLFGQGVGIGDTSNIDNSDDELETVKSPIRDFKTFTIPNSNILIDVGAQISEKGKLLVSSKIKMAPGKGTFHNINLHNMDCQKMSPNRFKLYGLYRDWSLQVKYTRVTRHYRGDSLINQNVQSTGWQEVDSGRERLGYTFIEKLGSDDIYVKKTLGGKVIEQGVWKRYGFNRATDGINWVGSEFNTTVMDFDKPMVLSISITNPKNDPVLAIPLNLLTYRQDDGNVQMVDITPENGGSSVVMGVPISREAFNKWVEAGANSEQQTPQSIITNEAWQLEMLNSLIQEWSPTWQDSTSEAAPTPTKDAGDNFMEAFRNAFGGGDFFKFEYLGPEPDFEDSQDLDDDLVTFRYKVHF